jgi:hypothetical protein
MPAVIGYPPSVELARLYERTSARRTRYMLGRLGGARIVLLPGEPTTDGTPTWRLLIQQRAGADRARPVEMGVGNGTAPPALRRQHRPYPAARPAAGTGGDRRAFNDPLPEGMQ